MLALDPRDPDPGRRQHLLAWLALQWAYALRPEALSREQLPADPDLLDPEALGARWPSSATAALWLRRLVDSRARIVPWASALYPDRLRRLADAPPVLAVRGNPALLRARCIAVVGARAASAYGRAVARDLGARLASAGLVVVSGLARGVDASAHEGALETGATLAFQACGPDLLYPPEHRRLARRIAARGAVLTELPVGTPPRRPYFPLRNRLIAAVSEAVVVVEARERSGSLITARHAADQGTDVYAVPGPITAATSRGPNRLLRDGAIPLTAPDDLLEDLKLHLASGSGRRVAPRARPDDATADPLARTVLAALREGPLGRDELARRLRAPAGALAAALSMLELAGQVTEDRDGRLVCTSPRDGAWL